MNVLKQCKKSWQNTLTVDRALFPKRREFVAFYVLFWGSIGLMLALVICTLPDGTLPNGLITVQLAAALLGGSILILMLYLVWWLSRATYYILKNERKKED